VVVEDAYEALRLAYVTLNAVRDALGCESLQVSVWAACSPWRKTHSEVVGLSLHWTEASVLPRHPLLRAGDVEGVSEAELLLCVIVARKVVEDCCYS